MSFSKDESEAHYKNNRCGKASDSLILVSNNQLNDKISKQILKPFQNLDIGKISS